jgi:AraC-like DNA-binding protein
MTGVGAGGEPGSFHPEMENPKITSHLLRANALTRHRMTAHPASRRMDAIFAAMPNLARHLHCPAFPRLSMADICEQTGLSRKQVRRQFAKAFEHLHHSHSGMELWREHIAAMPTDYLEQVRAVCA